MLCKKMVLKRKLDLHKSMTVSVVKVLFLAFCTKLSESREAGRSAHIKPELGGSGGMFTHFHPLLHDFFAPPPRGVCVFPFSLHRGSFHYLHTDFSTEMHAKNKMYRNSIFFSKYIKIHSN